MDYKRWVLISKFVTALTRSKLDRISMTLVMQGRLIFLFSTSGHNLIDNQHFCMHHQNRTVSCNKNMIIDITDAAEIFEIYIKGASCNKLLL